MFYSLFGMGFIAGFLIIIGVVFLLVNLGIISAAVWAWWPIILIVVGIYILTLKKRRKKIAVHNIFSKLASDDRIQSKLNKIIETVDNVVEKKIDEWHEEATNKRETRDDINEDESFNGKQKIHL
jgi:membrane-bound ClpP family serine protease